MKKKTKIVATIGPASDKEEVLREFFLSGVNVCRLNFSHGTHESHKKTMDRIKALREDMGLAIALMMDTKGPEIRTGQMEEGPILLEEGDRYDFLSQEVLGDQHQASLSYKDLWKDISPGQTLLVDDGLLAMEVEEVEEGRIRARALNRGEIGSHKGINLPGAKVRLPSLTPKDVEDIRFGLAQEVDFIAASFIRRAEDILAIRKILEENQASQIKIIAKIENQEGLDNLDAIVDVADGVMVARGDLGVEVDTEEIPLIQKAMIQRCVEEGIPVITATQMLDSMIRNPRPTRAETTDVANAIFDGTSAIMLSGETASGAYPVEAVKTMCRIAKKTEESLDYDLHMRRAEKNMDLTTSNTIARSAVVMAQELQVAAIVVATVSGYSSRAVAKFRPKEPIIAVTPNPRALRQMALNWGVQGILAPDPVEDVLEETVPQALKAGLIKEGDLVVFTAGIPQGIAGSTNLIKVHQVANAVAKGLGIGKDKAIGTACVVNRRGDHSRDFTEGDILVAPAYDPSLVPLLDRAGGLVIEEEGMTSGGALAGLSANIPTIVGAKGALKKIRHRQTITINAQSGEVWLGNVDSR
ncbi:MAG: pyruvate kinase [Tissierellia bacterium]|nr:pyruvate kinase [Tissierellia bacterium]